MEAMTIRNNRGRLVAAILVDGEKMTIPQAARQTRVDVSRVRRRVRELGPILTTDQIRTRKSDLPEAVAARQARIESSPRYRRLYNSAENSAEEKKKLARIPSPTRWEYELRGMQP